MVESLKEEADPLSLKREVPIRPLKERVGSIFFKGPKLQIDRRLCNTCQISPMMRKMDSLENFTSI